MIRRDWPLGPDVLHPRPSHWHPSHWLLIGQTEHALLSWEMARVWGGVGIAPIVCPHDEADHPLAEVRRELLLAIKKHDAGWAGYLDHPAMDGDRGRPYNFMKMPPAVVQPMWSDSITVCRKLGPLAGWAVASHFSELQSKLDHDYHLWKPWLAKVDADRAEWLEQWLATSPHHTKSVAADCLAWLKAFDWMSLWLCCYSPVEGDPTEPKAEPKTEPMRLDTLPNQQGSIRFQLHSEKNVVQISPWPFTVEELELRAPVMKVPVGNYASAQELLEQAVDAEVLWRLVP